MSVLQHGYAHVDYGRTGELGAARPVASVLEELAVGRARLEAVAGGRFLPVMVPPWNHADDAVVARLVEAGYIGLSRWGERCEPRVPGLHQCNVQVDIMYWKGPCFAGEWLVLGSLVGALRRRRISKDSQLAEEPVGLMTHHLVHDEDCWTFCEQLFEWLGARVDWQEAAHIFEAVERPQPSSVSSPSSSP